MKRSVLVEAPILIRVATGLFLLWAAVAVVVAVAAFVLAVRSDRVDRDVPAAQAATPSGQPATPTRQPQSPRPSAVPAGAQLVTTDVEFGHVSGAPSAIAEAPHIFYAISCRDHLLTVATTRETIYADLPCGQYDLSDNVVRPYLGEPVRVRVSTEPHVRLIIEVSSPGAAQFLADRVWIQAR